ncbi:MAG: hypothetical protein ACW96N_06245 [Candidatus Thorarchaeota archaeon]|jgi:hypothetical protein
MLQDSTNRKRIIGLVIASSVFVLWILVDLYVFPLFGMSSYVLYEVLAYGTWTIITLVCFGILSWAGCFSLRRQTDDSSEVGGIAG